MPSEPQIAFLYEHPTWSEKLIQSFQNRGIALELINIAQLDFNPDTETPPFALAVNRINIMPSKERSPSIAAHTIHYLTWLETMGVRMINGSRAHFTGASKAVQNGLFSKLGLPCPASAAVHQVSDIPKAAERIGFPLIIKPNIGGSGSGISKYETREELSAALDSGTIELGIDGTGLVQEYIQSDGYVYRVEVLGENLFYSIRQKMKANTFNYCAADGCSVSSQPNRTQKDDFDFCALNAADKNEPLIQPFSVDTEILNQVTAIVRQARADLGGVEYLMDTRTKKPCFYDFNPYSNFVTNGEDLFGFSPENRFIDYIMSMV